MFLLITKKGKSHYVPLSKRAVETLRTIERLIDSRVFPSGMEVMEKNLYIIKRAGQALKRLLESQPCFLTSFIHPYVTQAGRHVLPLSSRV